jgi:ureidoacrylate peracid hydrolase
MQNDFVHPDGATARWMRDRLTAEGRAPAAGPTLVERMVGTLEDLIVAARAAGVHVVWARWENNAETRNRFMDSEGWWPCEEGTWGADFYGELGPTGDEHVVTKRRHSAFFGTDLGAELSARGVETVLVTGTATQGCVESTMRDACDWDFWAVVVDDCCGQMDEEEHLLALRRMGRVFGVRTTSKDLITAWTA